MAIESSNFSASVTLPLTTSVPNAEKAEIEGFNAELERRDRIIEEQDATIKAKEKLIPEKDAELLQRIREKDRELLRLTSEKTALLLSRKQLQMDWEKWKHAQEKRWERENEACIEGQALLSQEVAQLKAQQQERDSIIEERDEAINAKEKLILEKDAEVQRLTHENGALQESERDLQEEMDRTIEEQHAVMRAKEELIIEKYAEVRRLTHENRALQESERDLQEERDRAIEERDAVMRAKEELILEKEAELQRLTEENAALLLSQEGERYCWALLSQEVAQLKAQLQERDGSIEERGEAIKTKEKLILEREAELQRLTGENGALLLSHKELQSDGEKWQQTAENLRQEVVQLRAETAENLRVRDSIIKERDEAIEAKEKLILEKDAELQRLKQLLVTDELWKKLNCQSEAASSKKTPVSSRCSSTTADDSLSEDHDSEPSGLQGPELSDLQEPEPRDPQGPEPSDPQGPVEPNWITALLSNFLWSCADEVLRVLFDYTIMLCYLVLFGAFLLAPDRISQSREVGGDNEYATTLKHGASESSMWTAGSLFSIVLIIVGCFICS